MLGAHAKRLEVGVPIDLFVVDIGGGLAPGAGDTVTPAEIVSEPFRAFLEGLGRDAMWSREPASLSLKDIFSGLDRTFAAMTTPAGHAGKNHAIIAANYMNVGLRLGYHYSIVDSTCDANPNQNTIYFRFAGGFADAARRRRRAELLRSILEGMRFKVDVDGDLVVARLKIAERDEMMAALVRIGELTGFTRQLDLAMTAEEMTERFAERFRMKSLLSCSWPGAEEGRHD
jgi:pyruvate,water dikinase